MRYQPVSAYALGHDDTTGSIKVGKFADFVIIDHNLFEIDSDEIDEAGSRNRRWRHRRPRSRRVPDMNAETTASRTAAAARTFLLGQRAGLHERPPQFCNVAQKVKSRHFKLPGGLDVLFTVIDERAVLDRNPEAAGDQLDAARSGLETPSRPARTVAVTMPEFTKTLNQHTAARIAQVAAELNDRPRKTLGMRTPMEIFTATVATTT